MTLYLLGAAYAAALALVLIYRNARARDRTARISPVLIVAVVVGSLAWIVTVPLALWAILCDQYGSVGGDDVATSEGEAQG